MNALRELFVATSFVAILALDTSGVGCGVTPKQAGEITKLGCSLVEATTEDAVVESVCAVAPELAELAALVAAARADAGASDAGALAHKASCALIPQTPTCASNAETLAAIRAFKAKRAGARDASP